MAQKSKDQKQSGAEAINALKEGDYLDPDPGLHLDPAQGSNPVPKPVPTPNPLPSEDPGYLAVVVTGATLNHNGVEYPHSRTVKLPRATAGRLTAIGLVKPLAVLRQELAAQEAAGLSMTTDAGGVEIITGGNP